MMEGIKAIRRMHVRVIENTGFTCAEEILYPENHRYLSDLLAYGAIGARLFGDRLHRMIQAAWRFRSALKNPTSGDLSVMMNSIEAARMSRISLSMGGKCIRREIPWRMLSSADMSITSGQACPTIIMKTCSM